MGLELRVRWTRPGRPPRLHYDQFRGQGFGCWPPSWCMGYTHSKAGSSCKPTTF